MSEDKGFYISFEKVLDDLKGSLTQGFDRLDRRMDEINRKIDQKADATRVAALEAKQANFEIKVDERIRPLEIAAATDEGVTTWKDKVGGAVTLFAASSVGAFLYYIASLGHK